MLLEELRGKELYEHILKGKKMSAIEIANLTGYTYGGVTGTVQRLRKLGYIREVEEVKNGPGRPTKYYTWRGH